MMKLGEVIELFGMFGFESEHVRAALGMGDSVHNAFEGLKIVLEMRWNEMNQTESMETLRRLKPAYDKIMGLKLKSATKASDVARERAEAAVNSARKLEDQMKQRERTNLALFLEALRSQIEKELKKDPNNQRLKDCLERLERGEIPF
jgi:hypothetical protein